jgi:peptide/nickel transport system permease protein
MKKILSSILVGGLTLLGLLVVTFFIGRKIPVDPVLSIVGESASPEVYENARIAMGLHLPVYEQFFLYLKKVFQGDFGQSFLTSRPVLEDLGNVFSATLELATLSLFFGVCFGILLGVSAAKGYGSWVDKFVGAISLVGYSIPVFWFGLLLLLIFYFILGWFPGPGRISVFYQGYDTKSGFLLFESLFRGDFDVFLDALHHIILPTTVLGYFNLSYIAKMTRSLILTEMRKPYVLTARVKGLSLSKIVWHHIFPNIRVPLISIIALSYGGLLEGTVLTETIFSWPGLGSYLVNSLKNVDMNAILGATFLTGVVFVALHTLVDSINYLIDPRAKDDKH